MPRKIRWGLLASGAIAETFARALEASETGEGLAIASRTQEKADAFGDKFQIPRRYGSYAALLTDPDVDAVYISPPHPLHAEWAIKAAAAGKHLLVEKPLGLNAAEAEAIVAAALRHRVFLMEAFQYRCHPQTAKVIELLRTGAIGDVSVIQATFSFHAQFNPASRLWNNALGGGGILDVGCYTTSITRLFAGAARGGPAAEPLAVTGAGHLHPETGVDDWAVGTLAFAGGIVAQIATGIGVNQENVVRIFGSTGNIFLPNPFVASRSGMVPGKIVVRKKGADTDETIEIPCPVTSFTLEADVAGRAILAGRREAESPAMTWADTLGNARTLDQWRAAIGLRYEAEKPQN